jgi:hypothetical protein
MTKVLPIAGFYGGPYMMKTLSVEQQIANLRPAVRSGFARNFHHWLMAGASVLVILSILLWHPVPLMIAIFLGIVGIFERRVGPNIATAIKAYDSTSPTLGEVFITISCWDTDKHYHVMVREQGQPDWEYDFVPQGWEPDTGSYPARIWRTDIAGPPVLTAVESGILIPRNNPCN